MDLVPEPELEPDEAIELGEADMLLVGVWTTVGTKILMNQTHSTKLGELLEPSANVRGICTSVHRNVLVGPTLQLIPIMTGFGGLPE